MIDEPVEHPNDVRAEALPYIAPELSDYGTLRVDTEGLSVNAGDGFANQS